MKRTVAFILAGGVGRRLSLLTRYRAKPAVPFAGKYQIIDFTLTNCVHSGIDEIYVLTQYISRSLVRHIGIGKPWDLDHLKGGIHILHPHLGYQAVDWYQGTADAIFQNIAMLKELDCSNVLILSGDHVYRMDYRKFVDFHIESGKPASLAVVKVPRSLCSEFGIATVEPDRTISRFIEKPVNTESNLASMGIYIFDRDFLVSTLQEMKSSFENLDFGEHIIPHLVKRRMISAFHFPGYWLDIGTLKSYYMASLELLGSKPRLKFYDDTVPILTIPDDNPPLVITGKANIHRSLVCNGCVIRGDVISSVLSPGVVVEKGARVENSIIFHDCIIRSGAKIKNAILDEMTVVGRGSRIGFGDHNIPNELQPSYLDFGIVLIGRKTKIPPGIKIGTNSLVCGSLESEIIPRTDIEDGGCCGVDEINP
ncbi:MAG: glucose-1-phosphate adenylyltransferase [Candidatus Krumholzibacteria bacterium]|nr:glucose-1-phosphate adenylyltransferase [Candidatus Krumholzibacteria bacterium]